MSIRPITASSEPLVTLFSDVSRDGTAEVLTAQRICQQAGNRRLIGSFNTPQHESRRGWRS